MRTFAVVTMLLATAARAPGQDLESTLEHTYKGAWALTRVEIWSDCSGFYTNNDIFGSRVSSRGDRHFEPGELGRIDKLSLKSERLELYFVLDESVLVPRQEGPFTLYDERACKAELRIAIPREVVQGRDAESIHSLVAKVLDVFDSRAAATQSPAWNQRVREPYPPDYEDTLARYEAWKIEQANARIAEVQAASLAEANRLAARIEDNSDYLQGFAAGARALQSWSPPACALFASTSFLSVERKAPDPARSVADPQAFRRGYKDGQALVFHLKLAEHAPACFQPLPPLSRTER